MHQSTSKLILAFCILLYIAYFTTASFLRHDNFYSGKFDLGNMDQTVWNTVHGKIFEFTDPNGTDVVSRLSYHADFILVLLAPFYWVWSDPKMLLLVQTVVLALGSVFVFLIANEILRDRTYSLVFSLAYLLSPSVQHANLYDFHPVTLATTLLLASYYFLLKRRLVWFLLFAILAGLTKEQIWLITMLLGLSFYFRRKKAVGLLVATASIVTFYYLVWHAIPDTRGGNHFALSYYTEFGSSPGAIVTTAVLNPLKTIGTVLQPRRFFYLYQLFMPLGFLSLFSLPTLLYATPDLVLNLLSNNTQLQQIYFHYTAAITPFVFIAAIYGVRTIKITFRNIYRFTLYYPPFTMILAVYLFGPLPFAKHANVEMFAKPYPQRIEVKRALATIPGRASVAATNNLGAHLSQRENIYTIPIGMEQAEYLAFLLTDKHAQQSLKTQKEMVAKLKQDPNYAIVNKVGTEFIVFQKLQR